MICRHCGTEIHEETDDLLTMGGAFPIWYSENPDGTGSMTCPLPPGMISMFRRQTHEPQED
jgi:hypothetical protein